MLKRFLTAALTFGMALSPFLPAQATSISSGDLIKGPGDTVYYYGADAKRYVFPNVKTYQSWYSDFSTLKTLTLEELQQIPLASIVTYRPGTRLVKVTTDPKVYAVDAHGTLRWVQTEALAIQLYGADWSKKVDDVPDGYFINYKIGAPISSTADYMPSTVMAADASINFDLKLSAAAPVTPVTPTAPTSTTPTVPTTPTAPTSTTPSTSAVTLSVSETTAQPGDIIALTATAQDPSGINHIDLYFDGMLIKTCYISSCRGETQVPISNTKSTYVSEARATTMTAQVMSQTANTDIKSDGSNLISVKLGQAQIMSGQRGSAVVNVDPSIAVLRVDIYVDNSIVKACADGSHQCQWTDFLNSYTLGSSHPVKSIVTDTLGRTYTSDIVSLTVGTTDSPAVTISPAKSLIYAGEYLDVTVSASDNDGIASIDVMKDGAVLKHCDGAAPCTATTGPWSTAGSMLIFTGRAYDLKNTVGSATSTAVSVVVQP